MSEKRKKRVRKAKLVPRTYMEIEEENIIQEQPPSIKIIDVKSLKQEPMDTPMEPPPAPSYTPFNFSVNVEVEEYEDEDRLQIDESAFEREEDREADQVKIKTEIEDPIENNDMEQAIEIHYIKKEKITPDRDIKLPDTPTQTFFKPEDEIEVNEYLVSESEILRVAENLLTSASLADRILAIEARNIIGRLKEDPIEEDDVEEKIQRALEHLENWALTCNSSPLLFKCYICTKSWWHLTPFRDHVRTHDDTVRVTVEKIGEHERNLIAYTDKVPEKADIHTHGNCWRCGKDYSIHKLSARDASYSYTCKKCLLKLPTCTTLKEHECTSPQCYKNEGNLKCDLCPFVFSVSIDKQMHMVSRHSVRSDVLMHCPYKRCYHCRSKYFIQNLHDCKNRLKNTQCDYCFRKFTNKLMADLHMAIGNDTFKCRVCALALPKRCMEFEHVLMHSTNFIFPDKCVSCHDFTVYLNAGAAVRHGYIKHKLKYDKRKSHFDKVLVPIICVFPNYNYPSIEDLPTQSVIEPKLSIDPAATIKLEITDIDNPECAITIKQEPETIKQEPSDEEYEEDIIRLDYTQNEKMPKLYTCNRCDFMGVHWAYKEHMKIGCVKRSDAEAYFCTKCVVSYATLKVYLKHFAVHGYEYGSCPECKAVYKNYSTLIPHFNSHIKSNYIRVNSIYNQCRLTSVLGVCKKCFAEVKFEDRFGHWESHLLTDEGGKGKVRLLKERDKDGENGEEDGIGEQYQGLRLGVLEMLIETLTCTKNKRIRDCPLCGHHFSRYYECKRHLIEHLLSDAYANSMKYGGLRCQICAEDFKKPDKYKRHMRDHGMLPIFQCELCDKAFSDSSNFTKHKKLHNSKVLICDLCKKKFQAKSSLEKHMELHKILKPVTCTICLKTLPTPTLFKKHYRTTHEKSNVKFRCQICQSKFSSLREKWDHLWNVHKERKFKADCSVCDESFRKYSDLKRHMMTHCNISGGKSNLKLNHNSNVREFLETPTVERETLVVIYDNEDDDEGVC